MTPTEFQAVLDGIQPVRQELNSAYRAWLERLATLSTTALALLVSLQRSYVPPNPTGGWLLAVCWGCLCTATLCSAWALFGEAQAHREFLDRTQRTLQRLRPRAHAMTVPDLLRKIGYGYSRPKRHVAAAAAAATAFAAALVSLTGYAILNL